MISTLEPVVSEYGGVEKIISSECETEDLKQLIHQSPKPPTTVEQSF